MNKKVYLVIIIVLFYFAISEVTNVLNIFYPGTKYLLTVLFALTLFSYKFSRISLTIYLLFILSFLFYRHPVEDNLNLEFYLWDWLKIIRTNKIVFINIVGNLLLFAPLVFLLREESTWLFIIIVILIFELMQFITKRGVFDIVDIFLNIIGVLLGLILRRLYGREKEKKAS